MTDFLDLHVRTSSLVSQAAELTLSSFDLLSTQPGGSKIILSNSGKDVSKLFNPIHPPKTLQNNLAPSALVGKLDPADAHDFGPDEEEIRIAKARAAIPHVDTMVNITDFEVSCCLARERSRLTRRSKREWTRADPDASRPSSFGFARAESRHFHPFETGSGLLHFCIGRGDSKIPRQYRLPADPVPASSIEESEGRRSFDDFLGPEVLAAYLR